MTGATGLVWLLAQALSPDPSNPKPYIEALLAKEFTHAAREEISAYQGRLLASFYRLPNDNNTRREALASLDSSVLSRTMHLRGMDAYREMHKTYPELQPLLLPSEYYRRSYRNAIEDVLFRFNRVITAKTPTEIERERISAQLDSVQGTIQTMLLERVQGPATEKLIASKVQPLIDEFRGGIGNKFWGLLRPLTEDEYATVVERLRRSIADLPIVKVDKHDDNLLAALLDDKNYGDTNFLISDPVEVSNRLDKALLPLYDISRFNRPRSFELRDEYEELLDEAMNWMRESKRRNLYVYHSIRHNIRKKESREQGVSKESPLPGQSTAPRVTVEPQPPEPVVAKRAPSVNQTPSNPKWVFGLIVVLVALGSSLVTWLILRRKAL